MLAQREQGGDGAGGLGWDEVAAGAAGLEGQVFAAEFAQIVGRVV